MYHRNKIKSAKYDWFVIKECKVLVKYAKVRSGLFTTHDVLLHITLNKSSSIIEAMIKYGILLRPEELIWNFWDNLTVMHHQIIILN